MQVGMIGLGRMGGNMVRRLLRGGHSCVVHDRAPAAVAALAAEGATGAASGAELVAALAPPRAVFMMLPAGAVEGALAELTPLLASGDTVVDGGNSHYHDALTRSRALAERGIHFLDMGTSGGVWGLERGYCLMIGGATAPVERLGPVFRTLAPGPGTIPRTPGREERGGTAELGYLHCGPSGAGHFVKMVHNGIEYGLMAAYAEGLNVLARANVGKATHGPDAGTTPLRHPERYQYDFDLAEVAELWRRGSVIGSWLLDLTAAALAASPRLEELAGHVGDSGEGRWTVAAAIDEAVPAHVLTAALLERFASRGEDDFQNRVLSAMRLGFGGHTERK
jgi:6-phosphogluconate dehydrogenase